ncbi:MAG: hemolysin family protein [Verrucomicrobiota bacterium JB025]|nr:hemolysin family protein [Verrucomicrobiota bacterium JB025]
MIPQELPSLLAMAAPSSADPGSGSWTLLIIYFSLAIGVSFFCSVWEAVLLSISQPYIEQQKAENPTTGTLLDRLKSDINAPLTSILTLNTIAHTVGAMGVGAQVAGLTGGGWMETLAGVLMTLAILILSEIIPKNLGARYWRSWAPWVGRCLSLLSKVMTPFVKLVAVFAPGGHGRAEFSREELRVMGEMGRREGKLKENELRVLTNLLYLREYSVHDIMTPRTVVFALPETTTVADYMSAHSNSPFSRIPIYGDNLDDVKGFVLKNDILLAAANDKDSATLSQFKRESLRFPTVMPLPKAFEQLVSGKNHLAIVLDEYGGIDGLVTMEDVVETLLGLEIVDEKDTREDMRIWARQLWANRAATMGLNLGDNDRNNADSDEKPV